MPVCALLIGIRAPTRISEHNCKNLLCYCPRPPPYHPYPPPPFLPPASPTQFIPLFAADCLTALQEWVLLILLLSLAKGWTVWRRKISAMGRVKLSIFVTIFGFVQVRDELCHYI